MSIFKFDIIINQIKIPNSTQTSIKPIRKLSSLEPASNSKKYGILKKIQEPWDIEKSLTTYP